MRYIAYLLFFSILVVFITACESKRIYVKDSLKKENISMINVSEDCKANYKIKTTIHQKLDSDTLKIIDKIVYSKSNGPVSPNFQRKLDTIVTNDTVTTKLYNYHNEIIEEKQYKIDAKKFDNIK